MRAQWLAAVLAAAVAVTAAVGAQAQVYRQTCVGGSCGAGRPMFEDCRSLNAREYLWYGRWVTEVTSPDARRRYSATLININGRHMNEIIRTARAYHDTFNEFNFGGDECGWCIWVNWQGP